MNNKSGYSLDEQMLAALRRYWGYTSFRPMQREVIASILGGRDTLALLPTGAGKSIIYQLPTLMREGVCIVVTPLIALMKDQVDRLRSRSIQAAAIHSGLTPRQIDIALDNCVYGDVKFLYLAPERLASEAFRLRLDRMNVSLLAVDEAHCISQWGYDFRPSYLRIAEVRRLIPDAPVLALTASATERVAEDIMDRLHFGEKHVLRSSFARPNLQYVVRHVDDKNEQLLRVISNVGGSGIVYMRTREGTEQVAAYLRDNGISANYYHGGLGYSDRSARQNDWTSGRTRIMVATNAFGMGIDKADVRFVVHYSMCDSLEEYYQEAGRAGRDGKRAYALLLVSPDDRGRIDRRIETEFPSLDTIRHCYESVCNYLQIPVGDGADATYTFNIHDFCRRYRIYVGTAVNAFKLLQQNGYLTLTEEMDNPARIFFCVSRDDLYRIRVERNDMDILLRTILRLYDRVFSEFRPIDEGEIAAASGYTVDRVHELLKRLWQMRVIRYIPSNRSPLLYFDEERLPTADVRIAPETYLHRKQMYRERYEAMLRYAFNEDRCRSAVIEEYFGGGQAEDCGICDICLGRRKRSADRSMSDEELLQKIRECGPVAMRDLVAGYGGDRQVVADAVDRLLAEGKISLDKGGFIAINCNFADKMKL